MVIKLYISGISGNKEVKKKQQRVQMILDSKQISYEAIDITEPGKEKDKEFMQQNGKVRESLGKYPLPPQIFNDDDFCGDYEDFDMANEVDELEKFLHIETSSKDNGTDTKEDHGTSHYSNLKQPSDNSLFNPYDYHTFQIKFNCVNGLKEQIVNSDDLAEVSEQNEDVIKSEVNSDSKAEITLDPTSENLIENVEPSAEEKEESTQENKTNDENKKKEDEESVDEGLENKIEGEDIEKEEKTEVEKVMEEKVENPSEERSPSTEEKVVSDDDNKGEEEEIESEKEENENGEESPLSEKSQEE